MYFIKTHLNVASRPTSKLAEACRQFVQSRTNSNKKEAQEASRSGPSPQPSERILRDRMDATRELIMRCSKLPDEWNVVQLCKRFNPNQGHQLLYDHHTAHLPLNVTLFKYERADLLENEPLRFTLHQEDGKYMYRSMFLDV